MARRLPTIARYINEHVPGLAATIERGFCNTDRKIGRLRIPGKGRNGNKLIVRDQSGTIVLNHNAAETYRYNSEVEAWLSRWKETHAVIPFQDTPPIQFGCDARLEPCGICQRGIKRGPRRRWLHVIDGGARFRPADMPEAYVEAAGDMGWWPIGPRCWKKHADQLRKCAIQRGL